MTEKKKSTKKAVEAVVSEETPTMVDNTTEEFKLVREAYNAYMGDIKHEAYTVRLESGVYFKTVNLIKDLQTVWADAEIIEEAIDNKYPILSETEIVDYIVEITKK